MLSSKDVIHSFFLPTMRVKQDAIPGMEIPIRFTPIMTTPEESKFPACAATKSCWEIACAQLCGLGHYRMRGYFMVHEQAEFDAWMEEQVAATLEENPEPAARPRRARRRAGGDGRGARRPRRPRLALSRRGWPGL